MRTIRPGYRLLLYDVKLDGALDGGMHRQVGHALAKNMPDEMFPQIYWRHFTCPSWKEPLENVWKGEAHPEQT